MADLCLSPDGSGVQRHHICRLINALVVIADAMDGDCDFEEGGDLEPNLAGFGCSDNRDLELDTADIEWDAGDFDLPGTIHGGQGI